MSRLSVVLVVWALGYQLRAADEPKPPKPTLPERGKPNLAANNSIWTPWMTDGNGPEEYHEYWVKMTRIRFYSPFVEGRMSDGREEYRAIFRPCPAAPYSWFSYHGMDDALYAEVNEDLTKLGYERLCYQAFLNENGEVRIQATWLKTREAFKLDPRHENSAGEIEVIDWKKFPEAAR